MYKTETSWQWALAAGGWCSAVLQMVLYREVIASAGGNELVLGAFLAGYLTWIAVGAALEGRAPARAMARSWVVLGMLCGALEMAVVRQAGWVLSIMSVLGVSGWQSGEIPALSWSLVFSFFIALPSGICFGVMFPRAVREGPASQATYARAYAFESAGYIAGGVLGTALLLTGAGSTLLFALGASGVLLVLEGRAARVFWSVACVAVILLWGGFELATAKRGGLIVQDIAEVGHSYVRTLAVSAGEERTLYSDCRYVVQYPAIPGDYPWLYAAGGMVAEPEKALVVAEDPEAIAVLRQTGFGKVTIVVPDRVGLRLLLGGPREADEAPETEVRAGDPLRRFYGLGGMDLAYVASPSPLSLKEARFYSARFHEAIRGLLSEDGVALLPVELRPNYSGEAASRFLAATWNLFRNRWDNVYAFRTDDAAYFLGSVEQIPVEGVRERLLDREGVSTPMAALAETVLNWERSRELREALDRIPARDVDETGLFLLRLALEEEMHHPGRRPFLLWVMDEGHVILILAALIFVAVLGGAVLWKREKICAGADAAAAGLAGLGAELAVMFRYQSARGMVYVLGGLMVASFMSGFFFGSVAMRKWRASPGRAAWAPLPGIALALAYSVCTPDIFLLADLVPMLILVLLGAGCGMNISALPVRIERDAGNRAAAAAWVDAFDHLGGALGGLVVSLLLLPVLGISGAVAGILGIKVLTSSGLNLVGRGRGAS